MLRVRALWLLKRGNSLLDIIPKEVDVSLNSVSPTAIVAFRKLTLFLVLVIDLDLMVKLVPVHGGKNIIKGLLLGHWLDHLLTHVVLVSR